MARSLNRWTGIGNIGKDPEIRGSKSGETVANFSIACSERHKDARGEWQEKTEWVTCVAFRKNAEIVRDCVQKGSRVYIEGKLTSSSWEDKTTGQKRYKTEILVNDIAVLSDFKATQVKGTQEYEISDDYSPF